jgi:hypothetical protein
MAKAGQLRDAWFDDESLSLETISMHPPYPKSFPASPAAIWRRRSRLPRRHWGRLRLTEFIAAVVGLETLFINRFSQRHRGISGA